MNFKRLAPAYLLVQMIAHAPASWAFDVCDDDGFQTVRDGQIRKWSAAGEDWIEFRTTRERLIERYGSGRALPQVAAHAARNALFVEFDRAERRPDAHAALDIRDMQSVAASCHGNEVFDFKVPWSGLSWTTGQFDPDALMPPVKAFLKQNGVID
ncbi:exported hypothetical protein [Burkholderia sp. 8Y]|uniref:hypothetical protein n=1 Tax=Burkholderia sp. 8Y TaxID=2653133 RepID=UPI0012F43417|nr:hypothetical protein [Burkholderia sp. 8Y]VXB36329.1 exported hypothetical protein [Burkholderia sp. 8Y]